MSSELVVQKHNREVSFLEVATGLELCIIDSKQSLTGLESQRFRNPPQKPNAPQKKNPQSSEYNHMRSKKLSSPMAPDHRFDNDVSEGAKIGLAVALGVVGFVVGIVFIFPDGFLEVFIPALVGAFLGGVLIPFLISSGRKSRNAKISATLTEKYQQDCARVEEHNREVDRKIDKSIEDDYNEAMRNYMQNILPSWEREADAHKREELAWTNEHNKQIAEFKDNLATAEYQLQMLYASDRIIPRPYQYPEAVCYLYDFLKSSPDEYDIKFALERVDAAEIKRMMSAIIQNQRQQILATIIASIRQEQQLSRVADPSIRIEVSENENALQKSRDFLEKLRIVAE